MKAVISTTYSNTYLYFLPIVTWCWNRLGVGVICFMPELKELISAKDMEPFRRAKKFELIVKCISDNCNEGNGFYTFSAPEHKEATYAQCSRLYGACLDLPEDEVLITSDCDMAVFNGEYLKQKWASFDIYGADLVPKGQVPICYISATVKDWRQVFDVNGKTYQECLDEQLGGLEAEHFRGNFWSRDQEIAYNKLTFPKDISLSLYQHFRTNGQNQFATKRYDRDDSYILDRLNPDTIDFHMNRPGYEDKNFEIILTILKYHYPNDNFDWLIEYTKKYKALL